MHTDNRLSRLGPLGGVLFVVLQLAGVAIGASDGRSMATVSDPTSKIIDAITKHAGTGVWVGAYLELASLAAFAVWAVWLLRERTGPLATLGLVAAGAYVAVSAVALVAGDVVCFGANHDVSDQALLGLFYLQSGLFFSTWGISAAVLALAPITGFMRKSALAIAALQLLAMAFPTADPAQLPNMLFLLWVAGAGVVAARARAVAPAAHTPAAAARA